MLESQVSQVHGCNLCLSGAVTLPHSVKEACIRVSHTAASYVNDPLGATADGQSSSGDCRGGARGMAQGWGALVLLEDPS